MMTAIAVTFSGGVGPLWRELSAAREVLFWLLLGGFVWVIGDLFQQYAAKYVGIGRGIPLSNTNQLWGLLWGVFVFGELAGADGAVLLRPGKEGRRGEPAAMLATLEAAGVPVLGELQAPSTAEGGDTVWLDEQTLLVGIGYRTNEAAVPALARAFPAVDVLSFDLPHWNGTAEVMHLMSFISPLDRDLAVVYPRIAPVRLLRLLADRNVAVVEVPDEEFESQGSNVLALGPRRALALDGNPETRRRMELAGVEVTIYRGDEISKKGDGGPTCLTRPLLRV